MVWTCSGRGGCEGEETGEKSREKKNPVTGATQKKLGTQFLRVVDETSEKTEGFTAEKRGYRGKKE